MRSKTLTSDPAPTVVAVLDPGDEAIAELTALVRERGLTAAQVTAVGAFARVWPTLGVIIRETPAVLRKTDRPELGIALIDLDR